MFGLMFKSTHDEIVHGHELETAAVRRMLDNSRETIAAVAKLSNGRSAEIRTLQETNYALDRTAAKFKAERDALQAKLDRMTRNLKRGRQKPGDGGSAFIGGDGGSAGITAAVSVG